MCDGTCNAFQAQILEFAPNLIELYIGPQYAWNKVILVEVLQRQKFWAKTLTCAWRPKISWIIIFLHHQPDCHMWSVGDIISTLYSHIDHKMLVFNFLIPCIHYSLPAELNFYPFCDVGPLYVPGQGNYLSQHNIKFQNYIMVTFLQFWNGTFNVCLVLKQVNKL